MNIYFVPVTGLDVGNTKSTTSSSLPSRCSGWHTWIEPQGHALVGSAQSMGAQSWAGARADFSEVLLVLSFEEPIGAYWSIFLLTIYLDMNFLCFWIISLE